MQGSRFNQLMNTLDKVAQPQPVVVERTQEPEVLPEESSLPGLIKIGGIFYNKLGKPCKIARKKKGKIQLKTTTVPAFLYTQMQPLARGRLISHYLTIKPSTI